MKRPLRLAALVLLGLLIGLEVTLQVIDLTAEASFAVPADADPRAPTILCLGDNHTYGIATPPTETYPARLQAFLRDSGFRVNVINLAAPGANTSQIRRRLPAWLAWYRPVAVLVLAGVNNHWNRSDTAWSDAQDGQPVPWSTRAWDLLRTRIRLVRGLRLLLRDWGWIGSPEERVQDRLGQELENDAATGDPAARPVKPTVDRTLRDLEAIVRMIRFAHARPVLLTYAAPTDERFVWPNQALRSVSGYLDAPLLDSDRLLRPLFQAPDGAVDPTARDRVFLADLHLAPAGTTRLAHEAGLFLIRAGATNSLPLRSTSGASTMVKLLEDLGAALPRFVPEVRLFEDAPQGERPVPLVRISTPFPAAAAVAQEVPGDVWGRLGVGASRADTGPLFSGRAAGPAIRPARTPRLAPADPPVWRRTPRAALALDAPLAGGHVVHFRVRPRDRFWEVRFGWTNGAEAPLYDVRAEICTEGLIGERLEPLAISRLAAGADAAIVIYTPTASAAPEPGYVHEGCWLTRPRLAVVPPGETRWASSFFLLARGDGEPLVQRLRSLHQERTAGSASTTGLE